MNKVFRSKKLWGVFLFFFASALIVYFYTRTDYRVKNIPAESNQFIYFNFNSFKNELIKEYLFHPSVWSSTSSSPDSTKISITDAGIEIPDILVFYQFSDSQAKEWYASFTLKNAFKWKKFLTQEGFKSYHQSFYIKGKWTIYNGTGITIVSHAAQPNFQDETFIQNRFLKDTKTKNVKNQIRNHTLAFESGEVTKIPNFTLDLLANEITMQTEACTLQTQFSSEQTFIAEFNLNPEEIAFWKAQFTDLDRITNTKIFGNVSSFSLQRDSIISYEYDENFNEIQSTRIQEIDQPEYWLSIKTAHPQSLWDSLRHHQWINDENELVKIPFNTNHAKINNSGIEISTAHSVPQHTNFTENYSFISIQNLPIEKAFWKEIPASPKVKKIIQNISSLVWVQKGNQFQLKLRKKEESLPFILQIIEN